VFIILAKYPLLTARKQCRLDFAKNCLFKKDIKKNLENRNNKYTKSGAVKLSGRTSTIYYLVPRWRERGSEG
jgi:hypothetical protein